jgi:hypothetical protein
MSRRPARITMLDWRRMIDAVKQAGVCVEITPDGTVRIMRSQSNLSGDERSGNVAGIIDARIASASWAKSK